MILPTNSRLAKKSEKLPKYVPIFRRNFEIGRHALVMDDFFKKSVKNPRYIGDIGDISTIF